MSAAPTPPLRIVLDTNVWLDWLVFADPALEPIKRAHAAHGIEICIDTACECELIAVLDYDLGKHTQDAGAQSARLAECRRLARRSDTCATGLLPQCRDRDDQKFLELARDCGADFLVTKDKALLVLARRKTRPPPCRIVTPREMGAMLENARGETLGDGSGRC